MTLEQLKARQKEILSRQEDLNQLSSLTDEQDTEYTNLDVEFEKNEKTIERLNKQLQRAAAYHKNLNMKGQKGDEQQVKQRYNIMRAIAAKSRGQNLDGLELEMHQEALNEARGMGMNLNGNIHLPSIFMQRDMTAGTDANGGFLVQTTVGQTIPILRPNLTVEALGATVMTGLTSNFSIPRQTAKSSGGWKAENATANESTPTFESVPASPHRLPNFVNVSNQLMIQAENENVQSFVMNDLRAAIQENVDYAAIQGSGTDPVPYGLLNTTGIGSVAIGTNGGAPTFGKIVDLIGTPATNNAPIENMNFLMTPAMMAKLMQTTKDSGSGQFVLANNNIMGYGYRQSTNVPSDLTKGSSDDCHAIIFGDFRQMMILGFGGVSLLVNPYASDKEGITRITTNSYWDVVIRQPKAFAAIKDARNV